MISRLYFNKNVIIADICKQKDVLDLGIVDHDVNYEKTFGWLHGNLKIVSKNLIGVDIDKKSIDILKKRGYNVYTANVENFNLKRKFDVIVAGDIIEHLNNVGSFLKNVKRHMRNDSIFVATVPNCLSFSNWLELLAFGKIKYFNEEHVCWYDKNTIKRALENHGFEIDEMSFIVHNPHFIGESFAMRTLKNIRHVIHSGLCLIRKQLAPTIFIKARMT